MQTKIFESTMREHLEDNMNEFMLSREVHRVVMVRIHQDGGLFWGYIVYKPAWRADLCDA